MESKWLGWAKQLEALASTGLHYSDNPYDLERFHEVARIARAMLAELSELPLAQVEAVMGPLGEGYVTPKVDVRGAVLRDGQILLVREKSDGLWTLPGGFADVGLSAGENVIREIKEEAGLQVEILGLYALKHKAKHDYDLDPRDFYKAFFLCRPLDEGLPAAGSETSEAGFFSPDNLPALSTGRALPEDISEAFDFAARLERGSVGVDQAFARFD